jgi:hypothetical protein
LAILKPANLRWLSVDTLKQPQTSSDRRELPWRFHADLAPIEVGNSQSCHGNLSPWLCASLKNTSDDWR